MPDNDITVSANVDQAKIDIARLRTYFEPLLQSPGEVGRDGTMTREEGLELLAIAEHLEHERARLRSETGEDHSLASKPAMSARQVEIVVHVAEHDMPVYLQTDGGIFRRVIEIRQSCLFDGTRVLVMRQW